MIPECNQDCIVIDLVFSFSFYKHISKASLHFQNFTAAGFSCRTARSGPRQRAYSLCLPGACPAGVIEKGSPYTEEPHLTGFMFFFLFLEQSALSTSLKSQTIEHTKFLNGYLVYVLTNDIIRQIIHCHMSRNMSCQVLLELGGVARVDQTFGK